MIPSHKKMIMKAMDADSLNHMAEQLRDGLCPVSAMIYEKKTFSLLVNRFCWNHEEEHKNKKIYFRAHVGLMFMHVLAVESKGIDLKNKWKILNLLHIKTEKHEDFIYINLIFSGDNDIRIKVAKLEVYTKDLHDAWPTQQKPTHIHEHIEGYSVKM